jgi:hypothetical protein
LSFTDTDFIPYNTDFVLTITKIVLRNADFVLVITESVPRNADFALKKVVVAVPDKRLCNPSLYIRLFPLPTDSGILFHVTAPAFRTFDEQ